MIVGAVFFDVDGTLVPGTSTSQFIGGKLGHLPDLAEAEENYRVGKIGNQEVSVLDAQGWSGRRADEVSSWLRDLPVVDGIAGVVARCRELALAPYLATLAWEPVGEYLCDRFGFDGACGPRLASAGGVFSGEVADHLDEFGKRDYAIVTAQTLDLELSSCVAVGDTRSDLPLFEEFGLSIAFNGDSGISARSDVAIVSDDLRSIVPALDSWALRLESMP